MQAQGSLLQGSMMSNFINIYQTEGTRGLWRVSEPECSNQATMFTLTPPLRDILTGCVSSSSSSGRHPDGAESGHSGRGGTSCLRHNQEAPASLRRHGRHHFNSFHVGSFGYSGTSDLRRRLVASSCADLSLTSWFVRSSSFTCGLAGALASNPVDVVRTRMMNQRVLSGGPMYKGTLDGVMQTWRNEGFFALYKGFWPNWLRLGPWNIIVSFQIRRVTVSGCRRCREGRSMGHVSS